IVRGVRTLHGAEVSATDLRGGAAMVTAALAAEGVSVITDIPHIDRGYERIENAVAGLGGRIRRI
ncbi:MAG TPA: UDP-N-acetylglucosamine 1-carboxyvinyltransferase, partial [Ruminococcus sp.]|nr:UDP-N-acetylglucosamine 1-carboxyvinyltransferase [Ruminococcus sp.]